MTNPPQPPGDPGSYGRRPDGYPAGEPDPTQRFQAGGTHQFGQPDQAPYGQPEQPWRHGPPGYDQYGQQQGYPGGPDGEPPKKKTGLIVGLAIAALLLIGGVVILILVLTGGEEDPQSAITLPSISPSSAPAQVPPSNDPGQSEAPSAEASAPRGPAGTPADVEDVRKVGERAIESIGNRDPDLAREVSCDPGSINDVDFESFPEDVVIEMAGDPVVSGDSAQITAAVTHQGKTQELPLTAKRESDRWCISG